MTGLIIGGLVVAPHYYEGPYPYYYPGYYAPRYVGPIGYGTPGWGGLLRFTLSLSALPTDRAAVRLLCARAASAPSPRPNHIFTMGLQSTLMIPAIEPMSPQKKRERDLIHVKPACLPSANYGSVL